jgi:hypothetical protein
VIAWLFACSIAVAQPDPRVEARERFDRGLALFEEGRYDAALAEFQRAYELSPSYRILYNLGRVYAETGDSVRSVDSLERFLSEGGASIERRRRTEVDALLVEQRARVSRVWVRTNVPDAQITIDGALALGADRSPLRTPLREPIRVTAGRHLIGARATGHEAAERAVELPGGVEETVAIDLLPLASEHGLVRIESSLRAVRVLVDGVEAGVTPIDHGLRLAPGRHVIEAQRPGYVSDRRELEVEARGDVSVSFELALDPDPDPSEVGRVQLRVPRASFTLSVDGRDVTERSFEVPAGEHTVLLEVADREPVRQIIDVPAAGVLELEPALVWTADAREERIGDSQTLGTLGWIGISAGIALFFGLGPVTVYGFEEIAAAEAEIEYAQLMNILCRNPDLSGCKDAAGEPIGWRARFDAAVARRQNWIITSALTGSFAIVGAVLVGTGIALLVIARSEDEIDADANLRLTLDAGALSLSGAF